MLDLKIHVSEDGLHREIRSGGQLPDVFFEIQPRGNAAAPEFSTGDFALIAMLPLAMHEKIDIRADFEVDSTLLDGLDHYQEVWHAWRPDLFRQKILIHTSGEYARPTISNRPPRAVAAFSSGLDSTFTLARHARQEAGRAARDVRTAVMIHGFDMPLNATSGFETLMRSGLATCEELDVDFVTVKTNWRRLLANWEMTFGVGLAAVLHQFSTAHDMALIATEESYENSFPVWGNSFWTDRFFSASAFKIESDGGAYDRIERARYLRRYPDLVQHLRVCWAGPRTGENCGLCPKCILTKLNLMAADVPKPWPFPQGLTPELIASMPLTNRWQSKFLELILEKLRHNSASDPRIVGAVKTRLDKGMTPKWRKKIRRQFTKLFRRRPNIAIGDAATRQTIISANRI
jgi:hypothetical protein